MDVEGVFTMVDNSGGGGEEVNLRGPGKICMGA